MSATGSAGTDVIPTQHNHPNRVTLGRITMTEKIRYRGMSMLRSWPEKIRAAQSETEYSIAGRDYARVAYGDEQDDWGADQHPCRDCGAIKGELHVPGCDVERCPKCRGQAIGCDCDDQEFDPNLN